MKLIEIDRIKKGVKDYWIEQISKISDLNLNFDEYQEYINNYIKYNYELILLVNNLPYSYSETAPEIVRCKDCKYLYNDDVVGEIEQLPSIQPERKTGQWIPSDSELEIKCNKCGKDFSEYVDSIDYIYLAEYPKFCPNCGVKMEGGEQDE